MPKTPINYNTIATVIYVIYCLSEEIPFTYYGSTTNFTKRKATHKSNYKSSNCKSSKLRLYKEIDEHGGWDNWAMKVVLVYPCQTKTDLLIKEQEFIFRNRDLNCIRSYISPELKTLEKAESNAKHYTKNKDHIRECQAVYRAKNKEKIAEKARLRRQNALV